MWESECLGCNNGYPYPQSHYTHFFKLEGDTTENSVVYKKLYRSTVGDWEPNGYDVYHTCIPWTLTALLREDTLQKKVFIVGSTGGQCSIASSADTLLFDFSLDQGDSSRRLMSNSPYAIGCNDSVFVVDSINYSGFQSFIRRTQFLNPINLTGVTGYSIYEGIGPSYGLFGTPPPSFEGVYSTTLIAYCIGSDSACGHGCLPTGVNDIARTPQIRLYPNPFSSQLTFSLTDNTPTTISLYNFLGQQVLQQTFTNTPRINTEQMQDGIYFYELRNEKGLITKGKVIKQ
jgi:hypothetical protein